MNSVENKNCHNFKCSVSCCAECRQLDLVLFGLARSAHEYYVHCEFHLKEFIFSLTKIATRHGTFTIEEALVGHRPRLTAGVANVIWHLGNMLSGVLGLSFMACLADCTLIPHKYSGNGCQRGI